MTTDIRIRTNGNYIAKGTLTIATPNADGSESSATSKEISVGPGVPEAAEQSFHIPHGSTVTIELEEKHADAWAAEAVEGADKPDTE